MTDTNSPIDLKQAADIIAGIPEAIKALEPITKSYCLIHKRTSIEIEGVKGELIWDYLLFNEITFESADGIQRRVFSSFSDEETEKKWNEYITLYGPKQEQH